MDLLEAPTSVRYSHPQWIVDELAGRWTGPTSWRRCWPPTTRDRG